MIDGIRVYDVQEKGEQIFHYLEGELEEGKTVTGQIDWDKRFSRMQQHSGEHIVSGIVHARFGYDNVGFHLNDELCHSGLKWSAHEGGASRGGKCGK